MIPAHRIEELRAAREAFVVATVVRAAKPTSVRPGDSALVFSDGTIEGFVGGVCAQESVRLQAARALETGEATLLRLLPGLAISERDPLDGVVVSHNPCLSGGALEIFLDPQPVAPRIAIVGDTPIARALTAIARAAEYDVGMVPEAGDAALVVASHGEAEEDALAVALRLNVPYVALVASPKRGRAVRESVDDELRARIHTPAGLDIGARTPADIAISILAELIAQRTAPPVDAPIESATDPICGMEVLASEQTVHLDTADGRVYFCCEGCRSAYVH
ncbi:XdhC family protein [Solirubrobacter phytolaccae]|uniref:XdhC family protein n=1 Tax=Solirubrobacter phytolaccae TaxID=1404360 RepID=A0A9X3N4D9_9ACTN|nr:XdhC family protein [Solirubrobacter phytolaccae]MDA0179281.1 XdhC family protein [Solirubrobacter phytolaccae]